MYSPSEHEVTIISADGVEYGVVEDNSIRVTTCKRCNDSLSECKCEPRRI